MSTPFLKKLRREATASPKKAALLGLLLLVAVYFWAPLLRQWTGSSENAAESSTTAVAQPTVAPTGGISAPTVAAGPVAAGPTASAPSAAPPKFDWRQLAQAIEDDPQMQPVQSAADPGAQRDPFVDPQPPQTAQIAPVPEGPPEVEPTPGELGLELSSTIVGQTRRTAVVNGKVYVPGRELEAGKGLVFVVRRIEPWGIVLERAGKQFELELPRPSSSVR